MALIKLAGRDEAVEIPNDSARNIKARWTGREGIPKAAADDVVDLDWLTFKYSQIKSIEIRPEMVTDSKEYLRELTPDEKLHRLEMMKKIRGDLEQMGIVKPQKTTSDPHEMVPLGDFIK